MKLNLSDKERKVWRRAGECDYACGAFSDVQKLTCEQQHRLCSECERVLVYGSHVSVNPTSYAAWNIDHIRPLSKGAGLMI